MLLTYSGIPFSDKEDYYTYDIEEIAHCLANLARFNGHTPEFYSVAQHSVLVARFCLSDRPKIALAGLLHDAAEAYVGDLVGPLKKRFPVFCEMETRILAQIWKRYKLPWSTYLWDYVNIIDAIILENEINCFFVNGYPKQILPLKPEKAKRLFLETYEELCSAQN